MRRPKSVVQQHRFTVRFRREFIRQLKRAAVLESKRRRAVVDASTIVREATERAVSEILEQGAA